MDDTVRAVVCVHYGGVACDIDALIKVLEIAGRRADRGQRARSLRHLGGRTLGSFGRFSTLSFHETKNFLRRRWRARRQRPADIDRAHVLYDKGTNRRAFLLGQVDKYSWKDTGSSFGMSDLQGAFLYGQLERPRAPSSAIAAVSTGLSRIAPPHAERLGIGLPVVPADCRARTTCST